MSSYGPAALLSSNQSTVPTPLKGAASIQKIFFGHVHYGVFDQIVHAHVVKIDKIHLNTQTFGPI